MPAPSTLAAWKQRLLSHARESLATCPSGHIFLADPPATPPPDRAAAVRGFRDNAGHRRAIDEAFLSWMLRLRPEGNTRPPDPDAALWTSLAVGEPLPNKLLSDAGPLFPHRHHLPIEVWTEMELSGVHALANAGRDAMHRARLRSAIVWLCENIQPDNATQHPWGVHAFAALGVAGYPDAAYYAEQLLHNALVRAGVADWFSGCILLDAARNITPSEPT
jgi:hypothetical protein